MNGQIVDFSIALASTFCMIGVLSEVIAVKVKQKESVLFTSAIFLPLYFTGIFQWLLFGIHIRNYYLIITCLSQIISLLFITKEYYNYHKR